jgi:phosphoribosylformimino-5-aminoimidazole carboxamide ribotide isomerase
VQIIPAIDLYRGRCVRLTKGEFSVRTEYDTAPRELAKRFADAGAELLHVVDLEGAEAGRVMNLPTILELVALRATAIQTGGGIRASAEVGRLLDAGVDRVVLGSVAAESPELVREWALAFGADKFCVAVDLKNGGLAYHGWQTTGGAALSDVVPAMTGLGISRFLSTDVGRDGTMNGPNLGLYRDLVKKYPAVEWLASGGVRSNDDLRELSATGVSGAVIGKALLEGTLRLEDVAWNS